MLQYRINLKNDDFFDVDISEHERPPKLYFVESISGGVKAEIANMPDGWSVDPSEILYIEPVDDGD